jgi:CheY-like chemotaxis protein
MPASSSSRSSGSKTILIVEDNALNLKLFDDLLAHYGYTTVVTSRGEAALELARQNRLSERLINPQFYGHSILFYRVWSGPKTLKPFTCYTTRLI